MSPDVAAALLKPVPGYIGQCARSPLGVEDDIPVGHGRFENVVAVGVLTTADGRISGWLYKTTGGHVRAQYVTPPLPRIGLTTGLRVSGVEAVTGDISLKLTPCTRADFRYRTTKSQREQVRARHG